MKNHFQGSVSTLVILIDGLVLAVIVIGLVWYGGHSGANTGTNTAPAARSLMVESVR